MFGVLTDESFDDMNDFFDCEQHSNFDYSIIVNQIKEIFKRFREIMDTIRKQNDEVDSRIEKLERRIELLEKTIDRCVIIDAD